LHDTIRFENLGIPAVPVVTAEFRTAARAQAAALNRPDFEAVFVKHPIQDQTKQEIEDRADAAVEQIVARLTVST
jgi:hypothetical protein